MSENHPDLMALVEGSLDQALRPEVEAHISSCAQCRDQARILAEALEAIDMTASRASAAFGGGDQLGREVDMWLGSVDSEYPAELTLEAREVIDRLPAELRRKVAQLRQDSLTSRLRRSVEKIAGLGGEAARSLADKLGAGAAPSAAPAIRKDATKVEDSDDDQDRDQDAEKD